MDFKHILDGHGFNRPYFDGQFLEDASTEAGVAELLKASLQDPTYPLIFDSANGSYLVWKEFVRTIGFYYDRKAAAWVSTNKLVVVLNKARTHVKSAYPVKDFR